MALESSYDITVVQLLERLLSHRPDLIEDHGIAPHITGCGVLLVEESLWSCPLDWDLASLRRVVRVIDQVSCHAKVTNLRVEN